MKILGKEVPGHAIDLPPLDNISRYPLGLLRACGTPYGRRLHENIYVTDALFAVILMDPGIRWEQKNVGLAWKACLLF